MSANEWANLIAQSCFNKPEKVPNEYKTVKDLSQQFNLSQRTMRDRVANLIRSGDIERKNFRIKTENRVVLTPHYKIIKKK